MWWRISGARRQACGEGYRGAGLAGLALLVFAHPSAAAPAAPAKAEGSPRAEASSFRFPTSGRRRASAALTLVPTFETIGVYWKAASEGAGGEALVRYRPAGEPGWRQAQALWFDGRVHAARPQRSREYRGSIVSLRPGVRYEVEALLTRTGEFARGEVSTWKNDFPVGARVTVPRRSTQTLRVDKPGRPGAYVLYAPAAGRRAEIDVSGRSDYAVRVRASYVIIRGLTLRGAKIHGIYLDEGVHDVVIEDNDISGWGRKAADGWGVNMDSAISGATKGANQRRFVIQRNRIHDPRAGANSWAQPRGKDRNRHPKGPQGISLYDTAGNHVIRFNAIYSSENYFNDGMGSYHNFSYGGFPGPDSDIYGNSVSQVWDDAIESEGGNSNVRIWGNYLDRFYVALGLSPTVLGPVYVFRNVTDRSQYVPDRNMNSGVFIKAQAREIKGVNFGGGRVYVYHNTNYRRSKAEGVRLGIQPSGTQLMNYVTRNNILDNTEASIRDKSREASNSFDFDVYQGALDTDRTRHERSGWKARPVYDPSSGSGAYGLSETSPGHDSCVVLPNFNDDYRGAGPDCGAQERGKAPLSFGVARP